MYSSAEVRRSRCQFRSELRKFHQASGCGFDIPVTCAGVGGRLGVFPLDRFAACP
jgi:hypothetical protein